MYSAEQRKKAIETFARFGCSAAEVAGRYGVSRAVPYVWRREILGHNGGAPEEKGAPVSKRYDELPDGVEELEKMQSDLKAQVRKLQLEIDVRQATLEILKKRPGHRPETADERGEGGGELVASGRMLPAQGGRAPQGAQRPRLPLSLARVDKDMRRSRHREVDAEKGLQPGQRAPKASSEG